MPESCRDFEEEQNKFDSRKWLGRAESAYKATFLSGVESYKNTDDEEAALAGAARRIRLQARREFRPLYIDYYTAVILHFAEFTQKELSRSVPRKTEISEISGFSEISVRNLDLWREAARRFIARFAGRAIAGISASILREFIRIVTLGTDEGEGTEQLARRLARHAPEFSVRRAILWVKTELVAASNYGAMTGARTSQLDLNKIWITSIDGRERPAHREANGQVRPLEEPFDVDGEKLMQPGDPAARLKNRMRCRCAVKFEPVEA